jgi:hypothetical protein
MGSNDLLPYAASAQKTKSPGAFVTGITSPARTPRNASAPASHPGLSSLRRGPRAGTPARPRVRRRRLGLRLRAVRGLAGRRLRRVARRRRARRGLPGTPARARTGAPGTAVTGPVPGVSPVAAVPRVVVRGVRRGPGTGRGVRGTARVRAGRTVRTAARRAVPGRRAPVGGGPGRPRLPGPLPHRRARPARAARGGPGRQVGGRGPAVADAHAPGREERGQQHGGGAPGGVRERAGGGGSRRWAHGTAPSRLGSADSCCPTGPHPARTRRATPAHPRAPPTGRTVLLFPDAIPYASGVPDGRNTARRAISPHRLVAQDAALSRR